jgi:hypothetical protein
MVMVVKILIQMMTIRSLHYSHHHRQSLNNVLIMTMKIQILYYHYKLMLHCVHCRH